MCIPLHSRTCSLCLSPSHRICPLSIPPRTIYASGYAELHLKGKSVWLGITGLGNHQEKVKKAGPQTFTEQLWYCYISWISNCDSIKVQIHFPAPSSKAAWTVITSDWCFMRSPIPVAYSLQPWQLPPLHQTRCANYPQTLPQPILPGFLQDKVFSSYFIVVMKFPFLTVQ